MIRQLIIPGIITGAAHAAFLFAPQGQPPPTPPGTVIVDVTDDFPPLPPIPPDIDKREDDPIELPDIKMPPVVFETITTNADSLFTVPFNPIIALPNLTGAGLMVIPPGDYVDASRRGLGQGVKELFNPGDLDNRPRTLFQPAPDYPYVLKNQGVVGEVVVNFTVDENGNVQDVRAVRSSHQEFEMPTIRAVSKWRFEPGRKDGKKVRFRMSVPVAFTLNEDA
jgi:protein TonB